LLDETNIDCLLVGDSLAMVMHGHATTLNASVEMMALHTAAVVKGAPKKFVVADLPFMSYRKGLSENMTAIEQIMKAGPQAVKLEGASGNLEMIRHCVDSGVPVMGHLGLTPQSVHQLGGFKVQGRDEKAHRLIVEQALQLQEAGCFSLVLECVPASLAEEITSKLEIPTIGIGAGIQCDGQVLVLQDMLGMNPGFTPKFLRKYFNAVEELRKAFNQYHNDVTHGEFPNEKESYL
jgi:3-methyl-2-oxobutanoate hydroxymethyltransferase